MAVYHGSGTATSEIGTFRTNSVRQETSAIGAKPDLREFGPDRIRVNAILPGWVMTERQLNKWIDAAAEALIDRSQALKDRIYPEHVARLALFLAADDSDRCTGQQFVIDAGWV